MMSCRPHMDRKHSRMRVTFKHLAGNFLPSIESAAARHNDIQYLWKMEQSSSASVYDEESFLDTEVLRKKLTSPSASWTTLVADSTEGSVSWRACRNHRSANNAKRDINRKNGCCHSTPLQEATSENILLNEYFSGILLSVVSCIKITILCILYIYMHCSMIKTINSNYY